MKLKIQNIEKLSKKDIIKFLSWDFIFNIYTRTYIEYLIENKNLKHVYLLDFVKIHYLNKELGFEKVNKKFKKLFDFKMKGVYIGRCFSGDEILVVCKKKNNGIMELLEDRSSELGLSFRYIYRKRKTKNIKKFLNKMIKDL